MSDVVAIVCGSRHGVPDGAERSFVARALDAYEALYQRISLVIQGGCRAPRNGESIDRLAALWAYSRSRPFLTWPADWDKGRGAGPQRNMAMAELQCVLAPEQGRRVCLAFPGGDGTEDMRATAKSFGTGVMVYSSREAALWAWARG